MLSNRYHLIEHIDLHLPTQFRDLATFVFTIATKMVFFLFALVTVSRYRFFPNFFHQSIAHDEFYKCAKFYVAMCYLDRDIDFFSSERTRGCRGTIVPHSRGP